MPAIPSFLSRSSAALLCGAAGIAVLALLAPVAPVAQEGSGLRGAIPTTGLVGQAGPLERTPRDPLATRQAEPLAPENPPLPSYRPVSQGAVPEAATTDQRIEELLGARPRVAEPEPPTRRRASSRRAAAQAAATRPADATMSTARTAATSAAAASQTVEQGDVTGSVVRRERPGVPQLSEETPLPPNAATRRLDAEDIERGAIGPDAERTGGIEARGAPAETSPFAPQGIRVGSFVLRPSLEQGAEWSSNASGSSGGSSDILSSTTLRLGLESNWSRHALSLNTFGTYRRSLQGTGFSELTAGLDGSLRLDLGGGFVSTTELGYQRRPESADLVNAVGRPLRQTFSASTEMAKTIGPVLLSARAAADRNVYADATLDTGATVSQGDRNNTLYGLTLRGGYEVSPALQPFVEAEIGRRIHDARLDAGGFARSATRYGARAGLAFDRGEKLSGEVAAGFLTERPDDARLSSVSGFTLDGNLAWSPLRGTQVTLGATTEIEASALAGSAGALVYGVSLGATREFGARLTGAALLSAELRRFAGTADADTKLGATASLTWWMNRYAGVTGRVGHERLSSTVAGRGYGSTTVYLGLTLQR